MAFFRDSLRALLYVHVWQRAMDRIKEAVAPLSHDEAFSPSVVQLGDVLALLLDDCICPVVASEIKAMRGSLLAPREGYNALFLTSGKLSAWAKSLPSAYPFLSEFLRPITDGFVENIETACMR